MTVSRRSALGAALATPVVLGARSARAQARGQGGSVLRFVPEFDLKGMDPITDTGLATLQHGYMIYDTLFAMDHGFNPRPQMVERFQVSDDGRVYEFQLRDGLGFHDGTPVRAKDCVASVRRWGARDVMGRVVMARVTAIDALDDKRFRMTLSEPFPLVIDALAKISSNACFIMREREAQTDPSTAVTETIGSGPFRFVREAFVPGATVVYARNAEYVPRSDPQDGYAGAKKPGVDRVEWRIISDPSTQVNALMAGEVDMISSPPSDLLPRLRGNPDVMVRLLDKQGWYAYMRPNFLYPPFNDLRARQALAHLVDQSDYMNAAAGDPANWRACHAFMVCGSPMESEAGMDAYKKPDLPRAKALLAEAGYNGEPIVVLNPVDNLILGGVTEVTIAQLRKIGANVQPVTADLATVFARRASRQPPTAGGWNLFHTRSLGVELNNALTSFPLASPCTVNAQGNRNGWFGWACDETIERLREQWAKSPSLAERQKVAQAIQQRAAEFLPFIPLGQIFSPVAHRSNLHGLVEMPVPVLWNATVS